MDYGSYSLAPGASCYFATEALFMDDGYNVTFPD